MAALRLVRKGAGAEPREQARADQIAEMNLELCLETLAPLERGRDQQQLPPIPLDTTIRSKRSLDELRRSSSEISQRWGFVTSLQVEDFVQALKAARAGH